MSLSTGTWKRQRLDLPIVSQTASNMNQLVQGPLFDVLAIGADGVLSGVLLFPFLDTCKDANQLRLVCHALRACVARFQWRDFQTTVYSVVLWRACFPMPAPAESLWSVSWRIRTWGCTLAQVELTP